MIPLFVCGFLAMFTLVAFQITLQVLDTHKQQYIEVYQYVQTFRPLDETTSTLDYLRVGVQEIPVKLIFGYGRLPSFAVTRDNLQDLFGLLGISVHSMDDASVFVHETVWDSLQFYGYEGVPSDYIDAPKAYLTNGPRVLIGVVDQITRPSYLTLATEQINAPGYFSQNYEGELERIKLENTFVNSMAGIIIGILLIILLVAVGALTYFILRARHTEFAILQVIGYARDYVLKRVIIEMMGWLGIGSILGVCLGWIVGFSITNHLVSGGVELFWPQGSLIFIFPFIILVTSFVITYRAFSTVDPVKMIQRSDEVN